MTSRFEWERALRADPELPRRLLPTALLLATYMTGRTGANAAPGLDRLMADTKSGRSTVLAHLSELHRLGWLEVQSPRAPGRPTTWRATLPAGCPPGYAQPVNRSRESGPHHAGNLDLTTRESGPHHPGAPLSCIYQPPPGGGYAQNELALLAEVRSPADRLLDRLPGDVRPTGRARGPLRDRVRGLLESGWTERALLDRLTADVPRPLRNPVGFLAFRLDALPPESPAQARGRREADRAAQAELDRLRAAAPECEHGVPGGDSTTTTRGEPWCPSCRSGTVRVATQGSGT